MARGLKFWIQEVEGLYYPCSENKGADQLRSYREADLRLCFRICKKPVFSRQGSFDFIRKKMSSTSYWITSSPLSCHFLSNCKSSTPWTRPPDCIMGYNGSWARTRSKGKKLMMMTREISLSVRIRER